MQLNACYFIFKIVNFTLKSRLRNELQFAAYIKYPKLRCYSNNDQKTLLCLFKEMYVVSDGNLDINKACKWAGLWENIKDKQTAKRGISMYFIARRINVSLLSQGHSCQSCIWRTFTQSTKDWNTNAITESDAHLYTPWARRHKSHLSVLSDVSSLGLSVEQTHGPSNICVNILKI